MSFLYCLQDMEKMLPSCSGPVAFSTELMCCFGLINQGAVSYRSTPFLQLNHSKPYNGIRASNLTPLHSLMKFRTEMQFSCGRRPKSLAREHEHATMSDVVHNDQW